MPSRLFVNAPLISSQINHLTQRDGAGKLLLPSLFLVAILVLNTQRSSKGNNRCHPGLVFRVSVKSSMGVCSVKFSSFPIRTSQVIIFSISATAFSGKVLITPQRVAGGVKLSKRFLESKFSVYCCCKI